MWQIVEQAISEATKRTFVIKQRQAVTGGDINLAYKVTGNNNCYFVKLNSKQALSNFEQEAYALEQIKQLANVSCPKPITSGITLDKSFLVLDYLSLSNDASNNSWSTLGKQLALMHQTCSHGEYGWQDDNYIGHTLQPNQWQKNWSMFFAEKRIGWQLQLLAEKSIRIGNIDHISEQVHQLLASHHPRPSLLHGDLWLGNVGFVDNEPVIFDPASYYGDRECDLAMTELFGQFPHAFYQGYQAQFPVQKDYEQRKHIYNFYHILNHANLFGGIYIEQTKAMLKRVLSTNFY